jgi:hypothetical protein
MKTSSLDRRDRTSHLPDVHRFHCESVD